MAIKIQTQTHVIPIEIGDVKLEFDMSDENIKRLFDSENEIMKKISEVDSNDFDAQKKAIKEIIDATLGDGSFDKLYNLSPSVFIVVEYFMQIAQGLKEEINKRLGNDNLSKAQKYLEAKEKINKQKSKQNSKK
ncbi:hypothetical protein HNQ35_000065 [Cerasibacillus quisquiliarum]|uniref:Phage protein n=1 Tax=Cerasibacillus quisquiliarum TaxID=227865 RepID=A0A511UYM6_9BACI|nr:hypothetical protein [Cerasibacillus quisquiliarum]MBB5144876.1 hypothetical protein [Cerasibacillus quisquiliarum]GEN30232.1 hypothetical protein CQU01_04700 [Cerasibacillus quisquiliarum]